MFVNFTGKKDIKVEGTELNFYSMKSSDWEETIFPKFNEHISEYTGKDIIDTLTPNFSTTTPVSLAVGQLTIMSTMKHYFDYTCEISGCGFPYITIEGTLNDWVSIKAKLSNLTKYKFNWFTEKTLPIIEKIIETKKGKTDKSFWKQMIRIKDGRDYYDPSYVNGWFVSFFPFDKNGDRLLRDKVFTNDELQSEMQEIPFLLLLKDEVTVSFDCIFLAGFVGLSQNEKTASIKPEIGWFIIKLSLEEQCMEILDQIDRMSPDSILTARGKILSLCERNKDDPYVSEATKGCEYLKEQAEKLQKEIVNDSSDSDYIIYNGRVDNANTNVVEDIKLEHKSQQVNNDQIDMQQVNNDQIDMQHVNNDQIDMQHVNNDQIDMQHVNNDQPSKSKKKSTCCILI